MKAAWLILCFIVVLLLVLLIRRGAPAIRGGAAPPQHVVVDALNLLHHKKFPLSPQGVVDVIKASAPALRKRYPGRVMYVLKDRDGTFNDAELRELYRQAAVEARVYIYIAERFRDPPRGPAPPATAEDAHSARGRDDFLTGLLAHRWRCPVMSGDRLRDFARFRETVPPFQVYEFGPGGGRAQWDSIRPDAYPRLKRPRVIKFEE